MVAINFHDIVFLSQKNVTSELPVALLPETERWQEWHRVGWDTTDGRHGGAERTAWRERARWCLIWPRRVSVSAVVWAWATQFNLPKKILRELCGCLEHQRRVQFEGCAAEQLQTITAILPKSKWSCLLLRLVLQDALGEVMKVYPAMKLKVFVGDITAFVTKQRTATHCR